MDNISETPLFALEEQFARQKAILCNRMLVQRLPDKGAKIKATLEKLEMEIEKRRKEKTSKQKLMSSSDLGKMEWVLGGSQTPPANLPSESTVLDSDDDEVDNETDSPLNPNPLKIIAESQISQRQPKTVVVEESSKNPLSEVTQSLSQLELDRFTNRLVKTDSEKSEKTKFVPSKCVKLKAPSENRSPGGSSASSSANSSKIGTEEGSAKYAEALQPIKNEFESLKFLSMEETIRIETEKIKEYKARMAAAPQKQKVYAYDKLKAQGLLGQYSVEMQVTRPVRTDAVDDEFDEDDLSQDEISDKDSEAEEDEDLTRQNTSSDLSKLVNSNLKLN